MKNLKGKIELTANLSIIAVAVLLCIVLVKSYIIPAPVQNSPAAPTEARNATKRGAPITLPGVDWQKNGKTLLLALSTTCHFCTQSSPFYQRVVKERGDTQLIVIVPQAADEGQSYLKRLRVDINDVRQASLGDIGVSGTPTLILVDSTGVVADSWVGALTPDKENEVISQLSTERASK
jgi:hypothetical protein